MNAARTLRKYNFVALQNFRLVKKHALAENMKKARMIRHWSIDQMAAHIGVDPSTIQTIESGKRKPNTPTMKKIIKRLAIGDLHGFLYNPDYLTVKESSC